MTAISLASYYGITREQAHENYMRALSQLVVYLFAGIVLELFQRPDYDAYLYAQKLIPTPEAIAVTVPFQVREICRVRPPMVRTIELVSA